MKNELNPETFVKRFRDQGRGEKIRAWKGKNSSGPPTPFCFSLF